MKRNINDYPLHLEERLAVIRDLVNHSKPPLDEQEFRIFALNIIDLCDGNRRAVPKAQKDLCRVPYKFAWSKS